MTTSVNSLFSLHIAVCHYIIFCGWSILLKGIDLTGDHLDRKINNTWDLFIAVHSLSFDNNQEMECVPPSWTQIKSLDVLKKYFTRSYWYLHHTLHQNMFSLLSGVHYRDIRKSHDAKYEAINWSLRDGP